YLRRARADDDVGFVVCAAAFSKTTTQGRASRRNSTPNASEIADQYVTRITACHAPLGSSDLIHNFATNLVHSGCAQRDNRLINS
ncbi:MAG: hypothetical protein ACREPE_08860, partial [Lysobacter sp.]